LDGDKICALYKTAFYSSRLAMISGEYRRPCFDNPITTVFDYGRLGLSEIAVALDFIVDGLLDNNSYESLQNFVHGSHITALAAGGLPANSVITYAITPPSMHIPVADFMRIPESQFESAGDDALQMTENLTKAARQNKLNNFTKLVSVLR
jgi:hypothetical protein